MIRSVKLRIGALVMTLAVVGACESNPAGPEPGELSMAAIAGSYNASGDYATSRLVTRADGESMDWIAMGAYIDLQLDADGTTSGTMFFPGLDEDGGDFEADLTGTWSLEGETVTFDHDADTFVRDMPFEVVGESLVGEETFGEVTVEFVLLKG